MVSLGDLLAKHEDWISLDPDTAYRQITARLWGKGLVLRGTKKGADIAANSQNRVRAGQFLISKIDARHGAFGLVPEALDASVVSTDFPTFDVRTDRVLPSLLSWISKTSWFIALCRKASEGSTNRVRLKEIRFLSQEIPLPPLDEQRRIVALLDGVARQITARQKQAEKVQAEIGAILRNAFARIIADAPRRRMGEVAPIVRRPVEIQSGETYHELGVRSFGRGLFDKPILTSDHLSWQKLFEIKADDIVFSNIKAWEGAFAIARPRHDGMVGSHRYLTCVVDNRTATPDFLWYFLQSPPGLEQVQAASPGSADRNRTLGQKSLEAILVPVPSLDAQQWFDALQAKAASASAAQQAASEELDHLLPAMLDRAFSA